MLDTIQRWWRTRGTDIYTDIDVPLEFHGSDYGGWGIAADSLSEDSVVLSFGIGEDITFDEAIIGKYSCTVHAFDPTPKALAYVEPYASDKLKVYPSGLGAKDESCTFYLPKNPRYVSGSVSRSRHLQDEAVEVDLFSLDTTMHKTGVTRFDMLKMDIEGSEYDVLRDDKTMQILKEQQPQLLVVAVERALDVFVGRAARVELQGALLIRLAVQVVYLDRAHAALELVQVCLEQLTVLARALSTPGGGGLLLEPLEHRAGAPPKKRLRFRKTRPLWCPALKSSLPPRYAHTAAPDFRNLC